MDQAKNFAKGTVSDGNYDSTATEIDLIGGDGVLFPTPPFNAVWWNASDFPDPADDRDGWEIVRVTAITDDTLTITRGQEGTDARDHNLPGRTYKLMAGLTAGGVGNLRPISYDGTSMEIDTQTGNATIGDAQDFGNGTKVSINDGLNAVLLIGKICTSQNETASTSVGTLAGKLAIYAGDGSTLLGYLPIYGSIT